VRQLGVVGTLGFENRFGVAGGEGRKSGLRDTFRRRFMRRLIRGITKLSLLTSVDTVTRRDLVGVVVNLHIVKIDH